jgi:hypothetical protein
MCEQVYYYETLASKCRIPVTKEADIYLREGHFSHVQLYYVACSKVVSAKDLHVLAPAENTPNFVCKGVPFRVFIRRMYDMAFPRKQEEILHLHSQE